LRRREGIAKVHGGAYSWAALKAEGRGEAGIERREDAASGATREGEVMRREVARRGGAGGTVTLG